MKGCFIRAAAATDSAMIVELFVSEFKTTVSDFLVYGCDGAEEYVRAQVTAAPFSRESMFVVAESGDGVVGAAEMKRRPGAIHLNYIAVRPDYRRRHLGRQLLGAAIRCSGESSGEIVLDVFDENASAVTWYTKLGFTVGSRSDLVELVAPQRGASGSGYIAELAQADACHQRFGFSQFSVLTKRGRCPVGRLGEGWFRLCHPDGVTDPEVFAALRLLDPGRRIFGVLRDDQVPHEQVVRTVVRSSRMTADIRETVSRLEVWP